MEMKSNMPKRKLDVPVYNRIDLKRDMKKRLEENGRHLYQCDINFIIDNVFYIIQEEVEKGNKVQITSFGSFYTRDIRRHYGRDVRNVKMVNVIPAHKRVVFSSGKTFKARVNKDRNKR